MAKKFKALENGTLSNPYSYVRKGDVVEIPDEQLLIYKKSSWLVPLEEHKAAKELPIYPTVRLKESAKSSAMAAINSLPVNENYAKQMDTLVAHENKLDGHDQTDTSQPDAASQGTGNLNPLG